MSPRKLQNEIKQDFTADSAVWLSYKNSIVSEFAQINYQDLSDHLLREFNRKIVNLGLNEDLMFAPFDSGFRFLGATIGSNLDPDAQAYIDAVVAAGATVTAAQKSAISDFVTTGKTEGWYSPIKRIYLPVWQLAAANAICMKSLTSGTFVGSVTHGNGYITTPNINGGYMDTNTGVISVGISKDSFHFTVLEKITDQGGDNRASPIFAFGTFGGNGSVSYYWNDGNQSLEFYNQAYAYINTTSNSIITIFGNSSNKYVKSRQSLGSQSNLTESYTLTTEFSNSPVRLLRSDGYTFSSLTQIGAFSMATFMTEAQDAAFTLALKTLWETTTELTIP